METPSQEIIDARNRMKAKFGNAVASRSKGASRRTKKVAHKPTNAEDGKLKLTLQRVGCQPIDGIQEVNIFPTDGKVLHFPRSQVWISPSYNTTAIIGKPEEKTLGELLPGVMNQLGLGQFMNAANAAKSAETAETPAEDDVPELVENFEDVSNE